MLALGVEVKSKYMLWEVPDVRIEKAESPITHL